MALTTRAFMESPDPADAAVSFAVLEAHAGGLIALTGGPGGPVDQAFREGQGELARTRLARLQAAFGDRLYVELQRHGLDEEKAVEPDLVEEAYRLGLPLVATNQCYFASLGDYESHDALIAIAEGRILSDPERRRLTPEHRFKTQAEMVALFADLPRRSPRRSRSPGVAITGRRPASRSCRPSRRKPAASRWTRRRRSPARRVRASTGGSPPTVRRPASPRRTIATGWISSSRSSSA